MSRGLKEQKQASRMHILLIEDDPLDAELICERLREEWSDCRITQIQTRDELAEALAGNEAFQAILADYSLPQFDGLEALQSVRRVNQDVPFIFVSGAIGEDRAIESQKLGATDYVLKNRLERLGVAVRRAMVEVQERSERQWAQSSLRQAEERFRLVVENVQDHAIVQLDDAGNVTGWNRGAERILGYSEQEILGKHFACFFTAADRRRGLPNQQLQLARDMGHSENDNWLVRKDGARFWASGVTTALRDDSQRLRGYAKILRDLTERKQLTEALRARAEELSETDRRKDEFLAMLAHELRNPLAPILSSLELLVRHGLDDPKLQGAVRTAVRQVRHMARLLDDLLDVSRITRGIITLQKKRVDLRTIINQAIETSRPRLEARKHRLTVSLTPESLPIEADVDRLEQVLVNLFNNAAKYTPTGGEVWVTADRAEDLPGLAPAESNSSLRKCAVVRVRDNGIGIAPEMLPKIWDVFTQSERGLDRSEGGLGVGLTLVKRLVEMHDGAVDVHSEGRNKGVEFTLRFPLVETGCDDDLSDLFVSFDGAFRADRLREPSDVPVSSIASLGKSILLVDDNVDAARMLASLLELDGHRLHLIHHGDEALPAAREVRPDVVLLDIGLPGLNGYEVARRLRKESWSTNLQIIAITGYAMKDDIHKARQAGFDHHLTKPVNVDALQGILMGEREGAVR
jgi:PAS domain S-box-containing protein